MLKFLSAQQIVVAVVVNVAEEVVHDAGHEIIIHRMGLQIC